MRNSVRTCTNGRASTALGALLRPAATGGVAIADGPEAELEEITVSISRWISPPGAGGDDAAD